MTHLDYCDQITTIKFVGIHICIGLHGRLGFAHAVAHTNGFGAVEINRLAIQILETQGNTVRYSNALGRGYRLPLESGLLTAQLEMLLFNQCPLLWQYLPCFYH
uniref:Uncharacterized protein n=1 Tax=Romanomermis culicivorax TaxID=13658 RepID=A0A915KNV7_ROMCU